MTKVRKQKKAKKFCYSVNRKRLSKKINKMPKVKCEQIQKQYENKKTIIQNLNEMGLSYDVNKTINLRKNKESICEKEVLKSDKIAVVKELEAEAKEPRAKQFRLPQSRVDWLCKLIDKHGLNYKKMALDTKLNPFQETWKQIRAKIKQFQKIPAQWEPYATSKMDLSES